MKQPQRIVSLAPLLLGLGACGYVVMGDTLPRDMDPKQAELCRQVVNEEVARQGISKDQVRRIYFERMTPPRRGGKGQNEGYKAWVYPKKKGPGALIVELSSTCQLRDVWYYTGPANGTE